MKPLPDLVSSSVVALTIKTAVLLAVVVSVYFQDLVIVMRDALEGGATSYIIAIPFLFAYFVYRRRKMLRVTFPLVTNSPSGKATHTHEIVGALLCILAFLLHSFGSSTFQPLEYHMVSLVVFVAAIVLILFNAKTLKILAIPIGFLLFLTPPPLEIINAVGQTLSIISSEASYNFLKAIGMSVSLVSQYGTPIIVLQRPEALPLAFAIDVACAGIYSLMGFTIFAVFVAYITRGPAWKKAAVFLAGVPLIYCLNIARIVIIVLIGAQYGMETAMQAFHLLGGWALIFIGTLILLAFSQKIFRVQFFAAERKDATCNHYDGDSKEKQHFCAFCGKLLTPPRISISKLDIVKISVLIASTILIMNLQVPVFALTEGPAEVAISTISGEQRVTQILPQIPEYTAQFVYRDNAFEKMAEEDAALVYAYTSTNTSKTTVQVAIEISRTRIHTWEGCLITHPFLTGRQPTVTQLGLRDVQLSQNPLVTARYFSFKFLQTNLTQVVLYWFENSLFKTGATTEEKYVKISLIAYTYNPENLCQIEEQLLPLGIAIVNYWQPIKTWSQTALLVSLNGDKLITVTAVLLLVVFLFQVLQVITKKGAGKRAYEKLSKISIGAIDAVHQTQKVSLATLDNISITYHSITKDFIGNIALQQKLIEAEKIGVVKRDIVSEQDEPVEVWKTDMAFVGKIFLLEIAERLNALLSNVQKKINPK